MAFTFFHIFIRNITKMALSKFPAKYCQRFLFVSLLLLAVYHPTSGQIKSDDAYSRIISAYKQWREVQYAKGIYVRPGKCNPDVVGKATYKGPDAGIPDEIEVSFATINDDNKLDALITFNPASCGGGNYLMNAQEKILVLSTPAGYRVDDKMIKSVEDKLKKGWVHIEKAQYGSFYGTYYEYRDTDARCCPSIQKPFSLDYATRRLSFD